MSSRFGPGRRCGFLIVFACVTWLGATVGAQPRTPSAESAADSIRCWWQTDKDAVAIGEQFGLTLTCGVVENSRTKVAADAKQFEPTALALGPFEVLDGTTHQDVQNPPWRYFQRQYRMRLLGETFFGQDVEIPPLKITYGLRSATTGEAEGRDQTILLPALPMRIHSLVSKKVGNIRDGSTETFGDAEGDMARATTTLTAAGVLFGFAVVLVGLSARKAVGRYLERAPARRRPLSAASVLHGCVSGLGRLKADLAREGWTEELVGRALTLFRVVGAVALGRHVAQTPVDGDADGRTGQIKVRRGILSRTRTLVSAATTAEAIARQLSNGARPDAPISATLGEIRDALRVFNAAHYRRDGQLDTTTLDAALDSGMTALRRLRSSTRWRLRTADTIKRSLAGRRGAPA